MCYKKDNRLELKKGFIIEIHKNMNHFLDKLFCSAPVQKIKEEGRKSANDENISASSELNLPLMKKILDTPLNNNI